MAGGEKKGAQRPAAKEGEREEEENRCRISGSQAARLRTVKNPCPTCAMRALPQASSATMREIWHAIWPEALTTTSGMWTVQETRRGGIDEMPTSGFELNSSNDNRSVTALLSLGVEQLLDALHELFVVW